MGLLKALEAGCKECFCKVPFSGGLSLWLTGGGLLLLSLHGPGLRSPDLHGESLTENCPVWFASFPVPCFGLGYLRLTEGILFKMFQRLPCLLSIVGFGGPFSWPVMMTG